MTTPSPFEVARGIGNNLGQSFKRVQDENVIDKVLAEAMSNPDPNVLQQSIGKILSSVAPERQGPAVQFLQSRMQNIAQNKQREALTKEGVNPDLPPALMKTQYEGIQSKKQAQEIFGQQAPCRSLTLAYSRYILYSFLNLF